MKSILLLLYIFFSTITISGCNFLSTEDINFPGAYKIDIQQGNIIDNKKLKKLELGMTKQQVTYLIGSPIIKNIFNPNRFDYIYSMSKSGNPATTKIVSIIFKNDKIVSISNPKDNDTKK